MARFAAVAAGLLLLSAAGVARAQVLVVGTSSQFGTLDPTTGAFASRGTLSNDPFTGQPYVLTGIAFAPPTGALYGVNGLDGFTSLYTVATANGAVGYVGDTGVPLVTIAGRADGVLFGYSTVFDPDTNTASSSLYRLDPTVNSQATLVGSLGVGTFGALFFDPAAGGPNGTLYLTDDDTGGLYTVDQGTGSASLLFNTGYGQLNAVTRSGGEFYAFSGDDRRVIRLDPTARTATPVATYSFGPQTPLDFVFGAASPAAGAVPEPSSLALLALVGGGALARRRRRAGRRP